MNLLAPAMGISTSEIPADHPDAENFLTKIPFAGQVFDVVIADGAVLRTHAREEYREKERESLRLRILQLAYGLVCCALHIVKGHRLLRIERSA